MAKTMKWPPTPVGGRIPMVDGVDTSLILVVQTLSDLQTNPFNDPLLSLGDVTYTSSITARARITSATNRLRSIISVERVTEKTTEKEALDGSRTFLVEFTDLETRTKSEVEIHG